MAVFVGFVGGGIIIIIIIIIRNEYDMLENRNAAVVASLRRSKSKQ